MLLDATPAKLHAKRLALNLTQQEMADAVGCSLRSWQHWEHGEREPNHPLMLVRAIRDLERELAEER